VAASLDTHHALIRFGLGPRPGEAKAINDPRAWLLAQVQGKPRELSAGFAALPSSLDYFGREIDYIKEAAADKKQRGDQPTPQASPTQATAAVLGSADDPSPAGRKRKQPGQVQGFRKVFGADLLAEVRARYHWAISTEDGFHERLTHFWSNHFAVSLDKRAASLYVMPMEREAIRPNVGGRFEDMLLAVARHPAMLRYLDNVASVGDDSQAAQRLQQRAQQKGRKLGLNENLAREILELHTLGVDGGYSQSDVTEFARALTGWSMPRPRQLQGRAPSAAFEFYDITHEPGARTVLGKRYAEGGEEQAQAILHDLARHPATAKHLATKLTRHFVADQPPPTMVARIAKTYLDHDGDLAAVYKAVIDSPEAWDPANRKLRTPDDWLVAAMRAGAIDIDQKLRPSMDLLAKMGQPTLTPRSPAGYADIAADWNGSDALFKRVQAAQLLSDWIARDRDPIAMAQDALGTQLDGDTATGIRRAESPQQGYALLLASPAFQWR